MKIHLAEFPALFLLALITGVFWESWLSLHQSNGVFSPGEFVHIAQTMRGNLAPMRMLMPSCILFLFPVNLVLSNSQWIHLQKIKVYCKNER
ncbi:MAG TPA: hypothetical protein VKR32_05220 [Puia sp.]|nr:hypothetical protein [Puia sp.]